MEQQVKLIAKILFHDSIGKRNIPQGVMFYSDSERAVKLVSGGFADVVERPKKIETPVEIKTDAPVVAEKPKVVKPAVKQVEKRVAKRKTVKK